MATVITNLLSAIPWLGKSLVESKEIIKCKVLDTIGIVLNQAGKKHKIIDKQKYLSMPYSFVAFLVGLIDGDGYIQITKSGKGYITMKLVISLHLKDLATLEYIKSVLELGNITIFKNIKSPICRLLINKTNLQEVFFPLLVYHNIYFLTEQRSSQFNLAMFILKNDIKMYDQIPKDIPKIFILPKTGIEYTKLAFFKNWIVGFVTAEGSFIIKNNKDGCFQIKQKLHYKLIEGIKIIFNTNRKITVDKLVYCQFGVSSKTDIQTVINFFSFSGLHPIVGIKLIQYLNWLENLSKSIRYKSLKYPNNIL